MLCFLKRPASQLFGDGVHACDQATGVGRNNGITNTVEGDGQILLSLLKVTQNLFALIFDLPTGAGVTAFSHHLYHFVVTIKNGVDAELYP